MKNRLLAACAAIGALALTHPVFAQDHAAGEAPQSAALSAPEIDFTEWRLDNGLRVIAVQDDSTSTVTTSMWYEIGAKLDPEGRSGFAHLFEHILSRKTVNMPYNMIYGLTADIGGTRNASNWVDRTNYFEQVPAEYLETMLWTHRERMAFPVVDEEVFDTERDVVKEELRTRVLAPPYGVFGRFVLPENTHDIMPQRRPGIGSIEDLDAATLEDARAFYQAYYGPGTATLIVAGNFEMDRLRALVDQYFADIPPRANPLDVTITQRDARRTQPRSVAAYGPNVSLPLTGTIWQGPEQSHPDAAALEVMSAILARGNSSRFYSALVETGKAVEASHSVSLFEEVGSIEQFATLNPAADMQEAAAILDAETARIRTELVTAQELAEAKNELISDSLRARETARGRAFELGEALVSTGDPRSADRRLAAIAAVTAEDVRRVASEYMDPQSRVDLTLERGESDPADYANPHPMPTFRTLPAATGTPRSVLPEGERQAPPGPGARPEVASAELTRHQLGNGLQLITAQTGDVPLVSITVYVPGGSASDPRELSGRANMAAALSTRGTATRSAREIAALMEGLGAGISASSRSDGTVFSLSAPLGNIGEAGEIFADVIRNPAYPEEEFQRERDRAIDALRSNMQNPSSLAGMASRPLVYGDAPYGNITSGTPESLVGLTREHLLEHSGTYWHPGAAQVVVTGGVSSAEAIALTERLFGDWFSDAPVPEVTTNPAGPALPARTVVVDMPTAGQAAVYLYGRGPERDSADYYPLTMANAVLGGGSSGRLFEEIRTKRSLSYGSYSQLGSLRQQPVLTASAQTANETADEVVQVMLDEYARIGEEPLSEDLLARRRLYLLGSFSRAMETSSGYANIMLNLLALDAEPEEAMRIADRLDDVTPGAANMAADRYFDPEATSILVVGNAAAFIDELRAIRPNVEVIPMEELDLSSADLR